MDGSMELEYNLAELDSALSESRHQEAAVSGPKNPRDGSGRGARTVPGTRRGSLVPSGAASARNCAGQPRQPHTHKLNLFHFDLRELVRDLLLTRGESRVSYHEYAVFSPPDVDLSGDQRTPSIMSEGEEALRMFRQAVKSGHGLDNQVSSLIYRCILLSANNVKAINYTRNGMALSSPEAMSQAHNTYQLTRNFCNRAILRPTRKELLN